MHVRLVCVDLRPNLIGFRYRDILVIAWVLVREKVYWTDPPNENILTLSVMSILNEVLVL